MFRFACSVSSGAVPGKPSEVEVSLQGNLAVELEKYLLDVYKLPRACITISKGSNSLKR
jgi:hypothetical protein